MPPGRRTLHMDHRIKRVLCEHTQSPSVKPRQQPQRYQPCRHTLHAIGMQGRGSTTMPGVERTQQISDLLAAAFTQHHTVGAHPECRLHQLRQAHRPSALDIRLPSNQRHMIAAGNRSQFAKLADFLDADDTLADFATTEQRLEQRGFPGACAAGDEYRGTAANQAVQQGKPCQREHAGGTQRFQCWRQASRQTNRNRGALRHNRRDDRVDADSVSC